MREGEGRELEGQMGRKAAMLESVICEVGPRSFFHLRLHAPTYFLPRISLILI